MREREKKGRKSEGHRKNRLGSQNSCKQEPCTWPHHLDREKQSKSEGFKLPSKQGLPAYSSSSHPPVLSEVRTCQKSQSPLPVLQEARLLAKSSCPIQSHHCQLSPSVYLAQSKGPWLSTCCQFAQDSDCGNFFLLTSRFPVPSYRWGSFGFAGSCLLLASCWYLYEGNPAGSDIVMTELLGVTLWFLGKKVYGL